MVGKIVGTGAYLSLLALIWVLLLRTNWHIGVVAAAALLFVVIGAFATFDPAEWRKRERP